MAETIYSIPVNEAFEADCECPVCELRRRFENDTVNYFVGPSLMEPDNRILTNDIGFCGRHFQLMYNTKANRLGLGLMLDTYMQEQIGRIKKLSGGTAVSPGDEEGEESAQKEEKPKKKGLFAKKTSRQDGLVRYLAKHETQCAVCNKLRYTLDRYVDILFHLYATDKDFRRKVSECKGFCLPHFRLLLETAPQKLSGSRAAEFTSLITEIEIRNLERIEQETDWFTKKFDYRNADKDWGNSRDAVPRAILKMSGAEDILEGK